MLINPIFTVNNNNNKYIYPSFKMNMKELKGIDRFVAKRYSINPQQKSIKTLKDFQDKCKEMVEKIVSKDFSGKYHKTIIQRKEMLKEWFEYVVKENGAYTSAMALMILAGITKELKPNEDTIPPVLNKGVLADTVTKIDDEIKGLKPNEEAQINFEKEYRLNLQKCLMAEEKALDENLNGWIIIPSRAHDPENFEANVVKLKMLSHDYWCTKSFNAEPYLLKSDFHIYMEKGKPRLGFKLFENEIEEIQGEKNSYKIPVEYYDIVKEHIKHYILSFKTYDECKQLETEKAKLEKIKSNLPNDIKNASTQDILEALGIECKKDSDGLLIISHYGDEQSDYSYSDFGIDENRLFKYIKKIEGNAYFRNSQVTDLGNLQSIGGSADFYLSKLTGLGKLKTIGGNTRFTKSQVTDLGDLQSIGGSAIFCYSKITSLGKLQSIGGWTNFEMSQVTNLGNLQSICGYIYTKNSPLSKKDFDSIKVRCVFE